jgi:hypothetical protein
VIASRAPAGAGVRHGRSPVASVCSRHSRHVSAAGAFYRRPAARPKKRLPISVRAKIGHGPEMSNSPVTTPSALRLAECGNNKNGAGNGQKPASRKPLTAN